MDSKRIFSVENIKIPYEIVINNRLKYMRVSIDTNGMMVSVPYKFDIKVIEKFLDSKSQWICNHYIKFQSQVNKIPDMNWKSGDKVRYIGNEYVINVFESDKSEVRVVFSGEEFDVYVYRGLDDVDRKENIKQVFRKFYIKKAREIINNKLVHFSRLMGLSYNDVRLKEQKTRWGSCSQKGNLNFNWKLIMAPPKVMDYVIIHELCHLKHLNHSTQFWSMVGYYMADYKEHKEWLKQNGGMLVI